VLSEADVLVLTDIYPAGEAPIPSADGRTLSRAIRMRGKVDPVFVQSISEIEQVLSTLLQDGDLLLLMGAGDIGAVAGRLVQTGLGASKC
jgi:UDP-N-acetylmuramate--alanine ligase